MVRGGPEEFLLDFPGILKCKVVGVIQAGIYFLKQTGTIEVRKLREKSGPAQHQQQAYGTPSKHRLKIKINEGHPPGWTAFS